MNGWSWWDLIPMAALICGYIGIMFLARTADRP